MALVLRLVVVAAAMFIVDSASAAPAAKYAAIAIVDHHKPGYGAVRATVGTVTKHSANPLLVQDTPWEPRIDNGYPNVLRTPEGSWQLFYGSCELSCTTQVLLFANSTDGLRWRKPKLGLYNISRIRPDLAHIGTANNIVLEGGGIGVHRDDNAPASRRYVAFGPGCYRSGQPCHPVWQQSAEGRVLHSTSTNAQDLAVSQDGLTYNDARVIPWPSPQRYDCHNNLMHDATDDHAAGADESTAGGRWLATTRDGFGPPRGRAIGIAASRGGALAFDTSLPPIVSMSGDENFQLYSQITFRWAQIYLGIVMVFEAKSAAQKVRCRLAWSPDALDPRKWQWVDDGASGLDGAELIPLGEGGAETFDSHICFAANKPLSFGDKEFLYYMGGNGPHGGARNSSLGLAMLRRDGFAAITAGGPIGHDAGSVFTIPIKCTGSTMVATLDVAAGIGGKVQIGAVGFPDVSAGQAYPLEANATNAPVTYVGGKNFAPLLGRMISLEIRLERASLYTIGFV